MIERAILTIRHVEPSSKVPINFLSSSAGVLSEKRGIHLKFRDSKEKIAVDLATHRVKESIN